MGISGSREAVDKLEQSRDHHSGIGDVQVMGSLEVVRRHTTLRGDADTIFHA
jgi:hypothetical protein